MHFKSSNIRLYFNYNVFSQSNMGSMNGISLSIMARILFRASLGCFGISIENTGNIHSPRAVSHISSQDLFGAFACQGLPLDLSRVCGHLLSHPQARYSSLSEYGSISPVLSLLGNSNPSLGFILILPLPPQSLFLL